MEKADSGRLKRCPTGEVILLYCTYFSLTWGYRMWNFALGLFFVVLGEAELLLTAIYGFLMGASVLVFGGLIGNWIDHTNRIQSIRKAILLQKISVILSASLICVILWFGRSISEQWHGAIGYLLQIAVILLAILAELATIAYMRIQLQKDWFVVITKGKKSKLANLNAGTHSVDLITNVVAPIVTGQIMTSTSQFIAGITIVVWHILALLIETILVAQIYKRVHSLQLKDNNQELASENEKEKLKDQSNDITRTSQENVKVRQKGSCSDVMSSLSVMATGWKVYGRQKVVLAGVALALLFTTVLGFDGITIGYIYSHGIPENIVGILTATASLMGVLGAFLYTQFRKCLGLERTGLLSYSWQMCCLLLCAISVSLKGTMFVPSSLWQDVKVSPKNESACAQNSSVVIDNSSAVMSHTSNMTYVVDECVSTHSYVTLSITVFLVGVCASRIGLYMTDLVVAQIQQENVSEQERGVVNGVQNSLNYCMDMFKFTLVILLPRIQTFGYLIIISFIFVSMGGICYLVYCIKASTCCSKKKYVIGDISTISHEPIDTKHINSK